MSQRSKQISKAIEKSRRAKKRAAKKKATPPPAGIHEPEGGWADGESVIVKADDKTILRIGLKLVKTEATKASKTNASLDIAKGAAEGRAVEADGVLSLLDASSNGKPATVPPHLLRVSQLGVSLEFGKVNKALKDQRALAMEDTKALDNRLLALEHLAKHLGIQGSLRLEVEDEDDAEDEEPQEKLW